MQTVQLLGGASRRAAFLRRARAHLEPGAPLALTLADAFEGFPGADGAEQPPPPDMRELDGVVYSSQPVAVRAEPGVTAIERRRDVVEPDGELHSVVDVVRLDRVSAAELAAEGEAAGYQALPARAIPPTEEYVGSDVVMLRA